MFNRYNAKVSNSKILQNLNPQQQEAVLQTEGPLLIFAGAGSGKTKTITRRIAYLISEKAVNPENILAVTFTKKAANEMLERVNNALEEIGFKSKQRPALGTFHSIGAQILRKEAANYGLSNNFSIYDSDDTENLVKDIIINMNLDIKQIKPSTILHFIESAKNELITPENYSFTYSGYIEDIAGEVYTKYQKQLLSQNAVDFGDLIYLPAKLLGENINILRKYQNQFQYILVDEYQDTNKAQYTLVKLLSQEHQNICVVGDDDQGIYAWRGADIQNILSFEKDFPGTKVIKLEQNYRSTATVIHAAVSVITQNAQRAEKSLWTAREEGSKITIYQAQDPEDEARYVVDELISNTRSKYGLNDFAILYRTNYQSRALEEELLRRGIPYKLVGGFRFYERKEIKDIISYLRFIHNIKDDLSLTRILNVPSRKVGPKAVQMLFEMVKELDVSLGQLLVGIYLKQNQESRSILKISQEKLEKIWQTQGIEKFFGLSQTFGEIYEKSEGLNILQTINKIIEEIDYIKWIDDGSEAAQSRVENIDELRNVASAYAIQGGENSVALFLQEITLIEQEQDKSKNSNGNAVTLMTLHSSKGLEFPCVIIVGMEEGILPHSRAFTSEKELEEERRLCYVGITRAKDVLWMTFAQGRNTMGGYSSQIPSRFLAEIPPELCEYYSWNG